MIVFYNPADKGISYSVETEIEKTVSVLLKFSPKTRRFLSSFYDLQILTQNLTLSAQSYNSLDIDVIGEPKLLEIKETIGATKTYKNMALDLKEELIGLLGLATELENEVFTSQDVTKIWEITMEANGEIQNHNLPPQYIEKKMEPEIVSNTNLS